MSDERVPVPERHQAFVQALDSHVIDPGEPGVPFEIELEPPLPRNSRIFLLSLTHSRRENEYNVQPIEPDGDGELNLDVDAFVVLAGYNDEKDIFALWDADIQREFSYSQTIQIKESTLDEAVREGIARQKRRLKKTPHTEVALAARPDSLKEALIKRYNRTQIRSLIDEHFPEGWNNSASTHYKIEETVVQFLEEYTDEEHNISKRRQFAQEAVAEDEEVKLATVQSNCTHNLQADPDSSDTLADEFDSLLEEIEKAWKDIQSASKSKSSVTNATETETAKQETSPESWEDVDELIRSKESPTQPDELYFPTVDDERPVIDQIDDALRSGKHIIITGPPGSGKTALAEYVCHHYVSDNYRVATATADWSTFDTIGGYRPGEDDQLNFKPGIFLHRLLEPSIPEPKNEWLVLDELNRADIGKAFGALFSALTHRNISLPFDVDGNQVMLYGNPSKLDTTPVTGYNYYIPTDWRLLATMNTADKSSLYQMGYAFMRRFAFIAVPVPDLDQVTPELIKRYIGCWDDIRIPDADDDIWPDDATDNDVESPAEQIHKDLSILWSTLLEDDQKGSDNLMIGPALIKDTLSHTLSQLQQSKELDYGNAFAANILPQLDGVPIHTAIDTINKLQGKIEKSSSGMSKFSTEAPIRTAEQILSDV